MGVVVHKGGIITSLPHVGVMPARPSACIGNPYNHPNRYIPYTRLRLHPLPYVLIVPVLMNIGVDVTMPITPIVRGTFILGGGYSEYAGPDSCIHCATCSDYA